jgi:hypothetical protein
VSRAPATQTSDKRLDSKFKDKYRMTPAEQEPMEESSLSDDSDSTVDGTNNIQETISMNMLTFNDVIKACRQDPHIIPAVGETLQCLIRDINARNAFRLQNTEGGTADAARNDVPAVSKQDEAASGPSSSLPMQLGETKRHSHESSVEKGTSRNHSPPRTPTSITLDKGVKGSCLSTREISSFRTTDSVADVASVDIKVSPSEVERYIALLEAKVAKLAGAALPGQGKAARPDVNSTATPPSQLAKSGTRPPPSLAVKNEVSHPSKLVKQESGLFSDALQVRLEARTRFKGGLPAFPTTGLREARLTAAKTAAAASSGGARRRIVPSGRSRGMSGVTTPPLKAVNMPNFQAMAHSAPSVSQAGPQDDTHAGGPGGPPQGPPSPGPRVAGYNSDRGDINVHTVSSIPPVHPPVFSDMRKHTRRKSPMIIKAYRDKVASRNHLYGTVTKPLPVIYMGKSDMMRGIVEHLLIPGTTFDPTDEVQQSMVDTLYTGGVDMLDQDDDIAAEWHRLVKQIHMDMSDSCVLNRCIKHFTALKKIDVRLSINLDTKKKSKRTRLP